MILAYNCHTVGSERPDRGVDRVWNRSSRGIYPCRFYSKYGYNYYRRTITSQSSLKCLLHILLVSSDMVEQIKGHLNLVDRFQYTLFINASLCLFGISTRGQYSRNIFLHLNQSVKIIIISSSIKRGKYIQIQNINKNLFKKLITLLEGTKFGPSTCLPYLSKIT